MAVSKALMKIGKKALAKGSEEAVEKATKKAITKATKQAVNEALAKSVTRGLPGAGFSTLAPRAGSTLDGILGRSSGLVLPEPKITPITLAESAKRVFPDENISTIGDMITKFEGSNLDKIYKNKGLSKKSYDTLKAGAREAASINNPIEEMNALGITSKSKLPTLNRDQYHYDTLGSLRNADGSKSKYVSGADVPDYMKNHLSNNTPKDNDSILRELFNDDTSDLNELYDRYEKLAQGPNSNAIYTPDNIDMGVELMGKEGKMAEQDFADRLFRGKKDIKVTKSSSGAKNIKVSRPKTASGVEDAVAETATTTNPVLANEIAEPRAQVSSAGGGMRGGGGTPTATASPDYGGLGDSGFNVHLKDGKDIDISLKQPMSKAEIRRNRAIRNLDDEWAKGLNATRKQYGEVVAKSKSAYNGYKTPAEMARRNGVSLDNINETPQAVVDALENRKLNIEKYAEERGVSVKLDNLDLTNIEPATKATMKMQGIDPDKIKYTGMASPLEAETLYKDLRNRAMKTTDGDRAAAYNTMADYVRKQIDNTMDNLNIDFSAEMSEALGEALGKNADRQYLRSISTNKKLKFSDLRREQADWIKVGNLSGNPIKEAPTINVFGVDTGAPNPFTAASDKIKEKIYERQAYGAGFAGGGSGAENNINFTSPAGGGSGTLGNLLGRAKSAGLVGAGVLGGLILGSDGGSGGGSTDFSTMGNAMLGDTASEEPEADLYNSVTIGGYTYQELEDGYFRAVQAGDEGAANLIANMMSMLDDKVKRYSEANNSSSSSSGIAAKQRAALNVLSGIMQNYDAQGPISGGFTQFLNAITGGAYNPAVSAYDSGAVGALSPIIKALGDTGTLSEGDQQRAMQLLPKTTDSEEAAKYKYQQLIRILQGAGAQ